MSLPFKSFKSISVLLPRLSSLLLAGALSLAGVSAQAQSMFSRAALPNPATAAGAAGFAAPGMAPATLDLSEAFTNKRQAPAEERNGLIRVSFVEDFAATYLNTAWRRQADGSAVLRVAVKSTGAVGLRARIDLPAGIAVGEMRVAGSTDGRVEFMPVRGNEAELWTPYTDGEMQTIELRAIQAPTTLPAGVVRVRSLMHFDRSPFASEVASTDLSKEASGSCNVDVKCTSTIPGLDTALEERKRSVALLQFRSGSLGFVCSGTLINTDKFPRAYFLTANHCISTAAEASSITTFWFFENVACGQRDTGASSRVQLAGGASVVVTNYMVDSTLLEITGTPPDGTVYAGWNAADLADNTPIVSVSHPAGDPMKYSEGTVTEPRIRVFGRPIDMYGISFTRGVIEGGSSGSGLFTLSQGSLQLRGILSATTIRNGGMSCTNTNELALYGRFQAFFPNIRTIIMNVAQVASDVDGPMPVSTARQIPLGGSVTAAIDYAGDLDVFRVVVTQPGHLTIYSTGGNDLAGALLDSNGAGLVAEDDVEAGNNEFGFTYRITTPGTYYVSVSHWDPTVASATYQVNARFSTAGENFSDIWWNANENGWGLALNHQDNTLAGALYSYDTDGQPLFLILNGATLQGNNTYVGNLVRYTGPAFNAVPWLPSQVNATVVGTMTLSFANRESLNVSYTVNGAVVSKSLTRQVFAKQPTCSFNGFDRTYASNVQDIWWNPNESGWGLNIIHQGDIIAVGLYNYDSTGRNVWYLMAPGTRQPNSSTFTGPLKRFTGPVFNASPWTSVSETQVGTMTVAFTNGNSGTLTYTINGAQVVKPIERLAFATPRTECESN